MTTPADELARRIASPRGRLWLVEGHPLGPELLADLSGAADAPFHLETVPRSRALSALASQAEVRHPVDLVLAHGEQLPPWAEWRALLDPLQARGGAGLVVLVPERSPPGWDAPLPDSVTVLPWPMPAPWLARALWTAARSRRLAGERLALWQPWSVGRPALPGWERAVAAADATLFLCGGSEEGALDLARRVHRLGGRAGGPFAVLGQGEAPGEGVRRALGGTLFVPQLAELPKEAQGELTALLVAGQAGAAPGTSARLVAWASGEKEAAGLPAALLYRLNVLRLDLPGERAREAAPEGDPPAPARLEEVERLHVERVLLECGGNRSEAARRLGMHRATLHTKLRRWASN